MSDVSGFHQDTLLDGHSSSFGSLTSNLRGSDVIYTSNTPANGVVEGSAAATGHVCPPFEIWKYTANVGFMVQVQEGGSKALVRRAARLFLHLTKQ